MSANGDPPLYETALARVAAAYPHGQIRVPTWASMDQTTLKIDALDATGKVATARGARICFGETVTALRGRNSFTANGPDCLIAIGAGSTFEGSLIQINGRGCVVIVGENCRIRGLSIVVSRENSIVVIGSNTSWESGKIISQSGNIVAVGDDCMMSMSVALRTSDGHAIFDAATAKQINDPADVYVGRHVWLGSGVRVNKGASIGSGTVVGQLAIVSGRLEPRCIYAGAPARKLKENIVWSRTHSYADIPEEFLVGADTDRSFPTDAPD